MGNTHFGGLTIVRDYSVQTLADRYHPAFHVGNTGSNLVGEASLEGATEKNGSQRNLSGFDAGERASANSQTPRSTRFWRTNALDLQFIARGIRQ